MAAGWPQVPCDPKMLISPLDTEGIAKFQLTTLEQQMRQDLPLDGASGIQISMLDIESYAVPENPPPMHPDDKALLMVSDPLHCPRTPCSHEALSNDVR